MKRIGEVSSGSTLRLSLLGIIAIVVMLALGVEGVGAPLDPAGMLPDPVARKTPPVILPEPDVATKARIVEAYGKLPLSFEVNNGQTDAQVKYLARGRGYTLFLTGTEAVLVLKNQPSALSDQQSARKEHTKKTQSPSRTVLRMQLVGANPHPKVVGLNKLPGKSNYFIGNDPQKWRTNIPTYAKVRYGDVYPNVDLVYYGNQRQLEYDLVVAPGADPKAITLAFEGADKLEINDQGDLVLQTVAGQVIQHAPVIYQEINGVKQAINGHYVLRGKDHVGIQVGPYDATTPLVIDPVVLTYSSYLGGNDIDRGNDIFVDAAGNAYVTGSTLSINFPGTAGSLIQPNLGNAGGTSDAFVTKINAAGTALTYSTYLGGSLGDQGNSIAVDGPGNAYVTGFTLSTDFPGTALSAIPSGTSNRPELGNICGDADAVGTKINAAGTAGA
ncbi:MAG: SBBP repeat-containing protein, partial [candidate division NC10 bacterium]|nr:SBBP repeat-containing protein [candidate division NC10 bacterium]